MTFSLHRYTPYIFYVLICFAFFNSVKIYFSSRIPSVSTDIHLPLPPENTPNTAQPQKPLDYYMQRVNTHIFQQQPISQEQTPTLAPVLLEPIKAKAESVIAPSYTIHFQLEGIIFSATGKTFAILSRKNDKKRLFVRKGDMIQNWTITDIQKDSVTFQHKEKADVVKVLKITAII